MKLIAAGLLAAVALVGAVDASLWLMVHIAAQATP